MSLQVFGKKPEFGLSYVTLESRPGSLNSGATAGRLGRVIETKTHSPCRGFRLASSSAFAHARMKLAHSLIL
jgi:hypothetical protein